MHGIARGRFRVWTIFVVLVVGFASVGWTEQVLLQNFEGAEPGDGDVMFRHPHFSGSTDQNVSTNAPYFTTVTDTQANDLLDPSVGLPGSKSLNVEWTFTEEAFNSGRPWLRWTTFNANLMPNPVIDLNQGLGFYVLNTNQEVWVHLGVREVVTDGPIGANGGFSGSIEYVGATNDAGLIRGTRLIPVSDKWQYVYIDIPNEPVLGFTGDGILATDSGFATIEHIGLTATTNGAPGEVYALFFDDFYQGEPQNPLAEPLQLQITDIQRVAPDRLLVRFMSPFPGRDYAVQTPDDYLAPVSWIDVADVTVEGPTDNVFFTAEFADPGVPKERYRVAALEAQPLFFDDFEGEDQGWTHGGPGDNWAVGTPTTGPGAAHSPVNCWGTGLDGPYLADAAAWLRSPAVDLTGLVAASITFWEYHDVDPGFHTVQVNIKDAADPEGAALATIYEDTGTSAGWTEHSVSINPPALGSNVIFEFLLISDFDVSFGGSGFYVDDVTVLPE